MLVPVVKAVSALIREGSFPPFRLSLKARNHLLKSLRLGIFEPPKVAKVEKEKVEKNENELEETKKEKEEEEKPEKKPSEILEHKENQPPVHVDLVTLFFCET